MKYMSENDYVKNERLFEYYLAEKKVVNYMSLREDSGTGNLRAVQLPYCHRWSSMYVKRFFSKIHKLETWFNFQNIPVTFVTFTTHHQYDIPQQILFMRNSFTNIIRLYGERHSDMKISYLANFDFHQDGYSHIHCVFFHKITGQARMWMRRYWLEHKIGSFAHGIDFRKKESQEIGHLTRYMFKHSGKVFTGERLKGWKRFSSMIFYLHHERKIMVRMIRMSSDISKILNRKSESTEKCISLVGIESGVKYYCEDLPDFIDGAIHTEKVGDFQKQFEGLSI